MFHCLWHQVVQFSLLLLCYLYPLILTTHKGYTVFFVLSPFIGPISTKAISLEPE